MSKIVDREIIIPEAVNANYDKNLRSLSIIGPNGSFSINIHPLVDLVLQGNSIKTNYSNSNNGKAKALTGTMNSLVFNAISGALKDYSRTLEIKGVGYRALVSGKKVTLSVGYSHDVNLEVPENLKVECPNGTRVIVKGAGKQEVNDFASKIRDIRKPNAFVLKGIFYEEEVSKFKPKAGKRDSKK